MMEDYFDLVEQWLVTAPMAMIYFWYPKTVKNKAGIYKKIAESLSAKLTDSLKKKKKKI